MKKLFTGALLASLLSLASLTAAAQTTSTNTAPQNPGQNFLQTVGGYFTSANTNYSWNQDSLEIAVGADYMSGNNWAATFNAQYDFAAIQPTGLASLFSVDADIRNAGIAGTITSIEGGAHMTLVQYFSVKLQGGFDAGYDFIQESPVIEPDLGIRSKLSENTFAGVRLSIPLWTRGRPINRIPDFRAETGFTWGGVGPGGAPLAFRARAAHTFTAFRHIISPQSF